MDAFRALPEVRRARGRYLYGRDGTRYLDCYLLGGRAILGHRPPHVSTVLKDVISTGRYGEYPSEFDRRLVKALAELLPSHPVVGLFHSESDALASVSRLAGAAAAKIFDPGLLESNGGCSVWYWRPFLDDKVDYSAADFLLPVVPFPGQWAGQALCARSGTDMAESSLLSPVALAAQLRSLQSLSSLRARREAGVEFVPQQAPRLRLFRSRGPYLTALCRPEQYEQVFYTFLEKRIILHPVFPGPSVWSPAGGSHDSKEFLELDRRCAIELEL